MTQLDCDPQTGVCAVAPRADGTAAKAPLDARHELVYIGDPMCSWCWGIEPALRRLIGFARERGLRFSIVVGGLRAGGGEAWTTAFKDFLRHHWQQVGERSGQPFSFGLFERPQFDYDTEPACRAVVVARGLLAQQQPGGDDAALYDFFAAIQQRFYVAGDDPGQLEFYREPCRAHGLDFDSFAQRFASDEAKAATRAEFELCRQWGVSGFPTVLLRRGDELQLLASGWAGADQLLKAAAQALAAAPER